MNVVLATLLKVSSSCLGLGAVAKVACRLDLIGRLMAM